MISETPVLKRIAIIRNAYRYDFGGGERMPVDLAQVLSRSGYKPTIISHSPKLLEYAERKNIKIVNGWWWSRQNWSGYRVILTPLYFLWQVLLTFWYFCLLIRLRPNIVHIQNKDDFIAASLAGKALRARVIWSDHADLKYIFLNTNIWYKNPVGKAVKFCTRLADTIIVTSQNDKRLIEEALGAKIGSEYKVIHNGIFDRPELLDKEHSAEALVFAATSRMVTAKGIGELIDAFKIVKNHNPLAELWLFGEGPEQNKFEDLAANQKDIFFKGFPKDSLEQVAKADIFVHPSYLEGFSVSIVEAAMLGKPIIACRVGGNPEIVQDGKNGILIPPRNVDALVKAMNCLAESKKLRQKYGKEARRTYEKEYVFEKIVKEKYLPLYE